jgi:pilus assembly protein CpaD
MPKIRSFSTMVCLLGALPLIIGGCQSRILAPDVPASYYETSVFERNAVTARAKTEYLEVSLNPADSQLRLGELAKIERFVAAYDDYGYGPLIMSLPKGVANPQLAVAAAAKAREIAWEAGIEYEQISGSAYDAAGRADAPLIMAFRAYDAVAPDCPSLATIDFADVSSNNDLPTLGCAVRTNLAAMIADPADLLGQRGIEGGDIRRREVQLDAFREGQTTGAARGGDEDGAISTAVQ